MGSCDQPAAADRIAALVDELLGTRHYCLVPNKVDVAPHDTIGAWTKRCYLAAREAMEDALRPHHLGATQWYVLHQLINEGPTRQRDLQRVLRVERATLSTVVGVLVRKRLVVQEPDTVDQRQKVLRVTASGEALWSELPDLAHLNSVAFDGISAEDVDVVVRVLRTATERLEASIRKAR